MNLSELLAVLKEINQVLAALQAMGLKIGGQIDVPTILSLINRKPS